MSHPRPCTHAEVARWLLEELDRRGGTLDEDTAAIEVVRLFGGDFCAITADNRFEIAPHLRGELERTAIHWPRELIWDRLARSWRLRDRTPPYR